MEIDSLIRLSARMDLYCHVKMVHRSSQIFFSNNEAPESNKIIRLAFDRAQVLKWVLRNNCNLILFGFLSPFLDNFDYPKICPFFEVVER